MAEKTKTGNAARIEALESAISSHEARIKAAEKDSNLKHAEVENVRERKNREIAALKAQIEAINNQPR